MLYFPAAYPRGKVYLRVRGHPDKLAAFGVRLRRHDFDVGNEDVVLDLGQVLAGRRSQGIVDGIAVVNVRLVLVVLQENLGIT